MRSKLVALAAFCIFFVGSVGGAYTEETLPLDSIKMTVERIIQVITDQSFQGEQNLTKRRETITQLVDQRFNFALMSRLALGDTWRERTELERVNFVTLFSDLLKRTYIRRIESYSDEKVFFTKQDIKKDRAIVYSKFERDTTEIAIIYRLKKDAGDWLVYDVVIEGASVIKQYRRQFSHIISEEKFEGLIIRLEEKLKSASAAS